MTLSDEDQAVLMAFAMGMPCQYKYYDKWSDLGALNDKANIDAMRNLLVEAKYEFRIKPDDAV